MKGIKPLHLAIAGGILLLLLAASPAYYFYAKYQETKKLLSRNPLILENEDKGLIEKIGKLIDLPPDESPTIATVTDVEKIKNQPFFSKAKNGDKVLIYNNAKKAILFDPIANKIIEVGPLVVPSVSPVLDSLSPAPQATRAASGETEGVSDSSISVVLYNGTSTPGVTNTVEKTLREGMPAVEIADKDTAQKKDYAKTMVIDITGTKKDEAEQVAKVLEAEISSLPAGETKPESDILVIVGSDKK